MNDLFRPKDDEQKPLEKLILKDLDEKKSKEKEIWIYTDHSSVFFNETLRRNKMWASVPKVNDFCIWDGKIIACDDYGNVFDLLNEDILQEFSEPVRSVCEYKGHLYAAVDGIGIYRMSDGLSRVAQRELEVDCICSFQDNLYDACDGKIRYTHHDNRVRIKKPDINHMYNYDDKVLFISTCEGLYQNDDNDHVLGFGADMNIYATFEFNDRIYVATHEGKVFDFITKKKEVEIDELYSSVVVPRSMVEDQLRRHL